MKSMEPMEPEELDPFEQMFNEDFESVKMALQMGKIDEKLSQRIADYSISEFGYDPLDPISRGEVDRRWALWNTIGIEAQSIYLDPQHTCDECDGEIVITVCTRCWNTFDALQVCCGDGYVSLACEGHYK